MTLDELEKRQASLIKRAADLEIEVELFGWSEDLVEKARTLNSDLAKLIKVMEKFKIDIGMVTA